MWENFEESDVEESSSGNSLKDAIGNVAGDTRWHACKKSDNKPIQLRLNEVTQMANAFQTLLLPQQFQPSYRTFDFLEKRISQQKIKVEPFYSYFTLNIFLPNGITGFHYSIQFNSNEQQRFNQGQARGYGHTTHSLPGQL